MVDLRYIPQMASLGGITQITQHLTNGFHNVAKCTKVPQEIRRAFREELDDGKAPSCKKRPARMNWQTTELKGLQRVQGLTLIRTSQPAYMLPWRTI